ncbi:hypothetical protein FISHEDRAFT_68706 [Fistulina hepatica ATCC 64428]|uniref:Uncharacterized protein n=1 Tax=Fistulina hepatica ATCC 64428 TaxID=1128425 RepID=A0A0D7AQK5_9AGAR|nr:hypothetical protein FISHEDRAFT_68706 [Fistulina hepatica ATCC 64428]
MSTFEARYIEAFIARRDLRKSSTSKTSQLSFYSSWGPWQVTNMEDLATRKRLHSSREPSELAGVRAFTAHGDLRRPSISGPSISGPSQLVSAFTARGSLRKSPMSELLQLMDLRKSSIWSREDLATHERLHSSREPSELTYVIDIRALAARERLRSSPVSDQGRQLWGNFELRQHRGRHSSQGHLYLVDLAPAQVFGS